MTCTTPRTRGRTPITGSGFVSSLVALALLASIPAGASAAQEVPNSVKRINATANPNLDIDGVDDKRVSAGIAVLDSGVDLEEADLNVVGGADCYEATAPSYACDDESPSAGDEVGVTHGTAVARAAAAIDNGIGTVGVAPGARIYAVNDIPDANWAKLGFGKEPYESDLAPSIAALKWVTAHADEIDVAVGSPSSLCSYEKMPFGYPWCGASQAQIDVFNEAAEAMVDAGVVWVIGASNLDKDVAGFLSPSHPDAIVVSGMQDTDGLAGGKGASQVCKSAFEAQEPPLDKDDTLSNISNWGTGVDVAAPSCPTSGAMPQVAGAAAILASRDHPETREDVEAIGDAITGAGSSNWTDDSDDGVKEPLLDVGDPYLFSPNDTEPWFTFNEGSYDPPACPAVSVQGTQVSGGCEFEDMQGGFQLGMFMPSWYLAGTYDVDFDLHVDLNGDGYAANPTVSEVGPALARKACDTASGQAFPWKVDALSPEEWGQKLELQITVGLRPGGSSPGTNCTQQVITVRGTTFGYATTELVQESPSANIKDGHWLSEEPAWLSWDG